MNAGVITVVGIDVSKYKSTVAARRPGGEVALLPFDISHDVTGIKNLIEKLHSLDDESGATGWILCQCSQCDSDPQLQRQFTAQGQNG